MAVPTATRSTTVTHACRKLTVLLQSKYIKARTSEFENIEESAEQARTADHIGDKPLVALTASRVIDAGLRAALSEEDQTAYADIPLLVLSLVS